MTFSGLRTEGSSGKCPPGFGTFPECVEVAAFLA